MNTQVGIPSGGGQARHPAAKASSMAMRRLGQSLGQSLGRSPRMGCQFFCIRRRCIGQSPSCKAGNQAIHSLPPPSIHPSLHPSQSAAFAIRRLRDDIVSMSCAFTCLCSRPPVCLQCGIGCLCSLLGPAPALAIGHESTVTLHDTASDSFLLRCCRVEAQVRLISLGPCRPGICSNPGSVIACRYTCIRLKGSMEPSRHGLALKK
jgi:hypothetical protein